MAEPMPVAIIIYGASGDLSQLKLVPAIYQLAQEKLLSEKFVLVGYARSTEKKDPTTKQVIGPMNDEQYRKDCVEAIRKHARNKPVDEELLNRITQNIFYVSGGYDSPEDQARLAEKLAQLDKTHQTGGNRLFYMSTPPEAFEGVIRVLGEREKRGENGRGWSRLIVEKPFGTDLKSAQELNKLLYQYWGEEQIFRIDHYLGKEVLQNIMVMRFANAIFEPLWNHKYIDHVQITVSETLSADDRAGYYQSSGALRDMIQNHIFQLMALIAMEPPAMLDAVSVRDEKVKVYKSIRPIRGSRINEVAVRGQYGPGEYDRKGEKAGTAGWLKAKGVPPDSVTETFAALKIHIDNWRWSGTPFYIRTGKTLPKKLSEVVIRFKSPPLTLFQKQCESPVFPNDLIIRVQPDEGMSWRLNGKVPGGELLIKSVALDMSYKETFHTEPPEAYERLINDAIEGDATLFIRGDEAEAAWAVVDPIVSAWARDKTQPEQYAPGTWGPKRSIELIEDDGRRWLQSEHPEQPDPVIACAL